jgi:hypothetical protein
VRAFSLRSLITTATAVGALAAPAASLGATIDVNSNADVIADDGHCTLREAVIAANTNTASGAMPNECRAGAGSDRIELPADHYTRTIGGFAEDAGATGDLDVLEDVTIHGAGAATTIIDAAHKDRVLDVAAGAAVQIEGVTLTGGTGRAGQLGPPGGDGGAGGDGGGIRNQGTLTLVGCVVTDNLAGAGGAGGSATGSAGASGPPSIQAGGSGLGGQGGVGGRGGGIFSTGVLTLTSSRIALNGAGQGGTSGDGTGGAALSAGPSDGAGGGDGSALPAGDGGGGGGLFSAGSGKVTVTDSAISENAAGRGGNGGSGTGGRGGPNNESSSQPGGPGGAGFGGDGGGAGEGGGLSVAGPLILSNTTINGNSSGRGGDGGAGHGGDGATQSPSASPANGGPGGSGSGGNAGSGGRGGGVLELDSLTAVNVTVTGNRTGGGAAAGSGTGGAGGTSSGGQGSSGGAGGAGSGGAGGIGGDGGGIWGETLTLQHGTVTANATGAGSSAGIGTGGSGGSGGTAGMPGIDGGGSGGKTRNAGTGGGILSHDGATLTSSILASNEPANCVGTFSDGGFNLDFPDSACPGDALDPAVSALANNGGPTPTQAIAASSPAHDRVPTGAACAATDQRGVPRPQGPACDAGAFELTPPPPPDIVAPVFSLASLSNKVFAVDPKGTAEVSVAAKSKKPKRGTTFRFTLSEAGRVVFTIERRTVGRNVAKKCRKLTRKNSKRPHCTLYLRAGRFAANGAAGPNRHKFSGRIGRKSLKPGRYRARLVAADSAGNKSKPVLIAFEVVRP